MKGSNVEHQATERRRAGEPGQLQREKRQAVGGRDAGHAVPDADPGLPSELDDDAGFLR